MVMTMMWVKGMAWAVITGSLVFTQVSSLQAGVLDSLAAGINKSADWMQPDFVKGACSKTKWSDIGGRVACGSKDIVARNMKKFGNFLAGSRSASDGNPILQNDLNRDGVNTRQNSQNLLSATSVTMMSGYLPGSGTRDLDAVADAQEEMRADEELKRQEEAKDRRYIEGCMGTVHEPIQNPFVVTQEDKARAEKDYAAQRAKYEERKSICIAALQNNKEGDKRLAEYLKRKPQQNYDPSKDGKKRRSDLAREEEESRNQARAENPIEKPTDGRADSSPPADSPGFGNKVSSCMDIAIPVLQVIGYLIPAVANLAESTKRPSVPRQSSAPKVSKAPQQVAPAQTAPKKAESPCAWDLGSLSQGGQNKCAPKTKTTAAKKPAARGDEEAGGYNFDTQNMK